MFENVSQHDERLRERNPVFENASQHNEQLHEKMAQEGRRSRHDERWQERNPVLENASQHNEHRDETMTREGRKKTICDVLDVVKLRCDDVRPYNERQQGRKQVFENARDDNEQGGLLIWHAST